jgi:hypothetical protein
VNLRICLLSISRVFFLKQLLEMDDEAYNQEVVEGP